LKHFSYRSKFILDALLNFEPVKRFKNRRYMSESLGVLDTDRAEEFRMSWR